MNTEPEANTKPGVALVALGVTLHAALLFGLVAAYASYVSAAKQTFDEYGMLLPLLSRTVVRLSELWPLLALATVPCVTADVALTWRLRRIGAAHAMLWVLGAAALLALVGVLTVYAVEYPLMKLREALAR